MSDAIEHAARTIHAGHCCPCDSRGCDEPDPVDYNAARALAEEGLLAAAPEPRADLADAWDEGYNACNEYQNAYVPVPRPNPYRKGN